MHPIDLFTVSLEDPENPILIDSSGRRTARLSGTKIEGQWEAGGRNLLLLSCDSPFEELISVCLVSHALGLIDEIRIGGWYSSGVLNNISVDNGLLQFDIFGSLWKITPRTQGRYLPFSSLPKGASRSFSQNFKRKYLDLSRVEIK